MPVAPPTTKDECKDDGWMTFNDPAFENQGQCVSSFASAKKKPKSKAAASKDDPFLPGRNGSYAMLAVAALAVGLVMGPLLERGLLRFMYGRDEVVGLLAQVAPLDWRAALAVMRSRKRLN